MVKIILTQSSQVHSQVVSLLSDVIQLSLRQIDSRCCSLAGFRVAMRNAIAGGIFLGMFQLVEIGFVKYQMRQELSALREQEAMMRAKDQEAIMGNSVNSISAR